MCPHNNHGIGFVGFLNSQTLPQTKTTEFSRLDAATLQRFSLRSAISEIEKLEASCSLSLFGGVSLQNQVDTMQHWAGEKQQAIIFPQGCGTTRGFCNHFCDISGITPLKKTGGNMVFGVWPFLVCHRSLSNFKQPCSLGNHSTSWPGFPWERSFP